MFTLIKYLVIISLVLIIGGKHFDDMTMEIMGWAFLSWTTFHITITIGQITRHYNMHRNLENLR